MSRKNVMVYVKKDILHPISWALREFEKLINVKIADTQKQVDDMIFGIELDFCVIIIDSIMNNVSTFDYIRTIKEKKPNQKILLIVSEGTKKEDLLELVKSKLVSGILVRPFTAEQLSDYIYKICNFQKSTEVPWYMQTGLK
ncbi:MAG: hypothetical protein N2738_03865 [Thermodesulfovibrionales bacterium]|nr:hypothetical protein [Thermodesulfovibrionales bacterium]